MEYSDILKTKYPCSEITGKISLPTGIKYLMANLFKYIKLLIIPTTIFSKNLEHMFGPNHYLNTIHENKVQTIASTFFVCSIAENMLMSTGAFEISINGELIWSKLATNKIPDINSLITLIDNALIRQGINKC